MLMQQSNNSALHLYLFQKRALTVTTLNSDTDKINETIYSNWEY